MSASDVQESLIASGASFSSDRSSSRLVPEEEIKAERERWLQQCMHEVWNLENAAFERINNQIDDIGARIQNDITRSVIKRIDDERVERAAVTASIRQDMSTFASLEPALVTLRTDVSAVQAEQIRLQACSDSKVERLRFDFDCQCKSQEQIVTKMAADLRQEMSAVQIALTQAQQEQTARTAGRLERNFHDTLAAVNVAQTPPKNEFGAALDKLRHELKSVVKESDGQATQLCTAQARTQELADKVEIVTRRLAELRQDQLSEATVFRQRIEAAAGERRQEQQKQLETVQLMLKEEQNRNISDIASLGVAANFEATERLAIQAASRETEAVLSRISCLDVQVMELSSTVSAVQEKFDVLSDDVQLLPRTVDMDRLKSDLLDAVANEVRKVSLDLENERRDRCRAFNDVERITEEMAKAATSTNQPRARSDCSQLSSLSHILTPIPTHSNGGEQPTTPQPKLPAGDPGIGIASSGFACLIGEMDAELRVELISRVTLLTAELRCELMKEIAVRVANANAELRQTTFEINHRLGNLENSTTCSRVKALEVDMEQNKSIITALMEDSAKKGTTLTRVSTSLCADVDGRSVQLPTQPRNAGPLSTTTRTQNSHRVSTSVDASALPDGITVVTARVGSPDIASPVTVATSPSAQVRPGMVPRTTVPSALSNSPISQAIPTACNRSSPSAQPQIRGNRSATPGACASGVVIHPSGRISSGASLSVTQPVRSIARQPLHIRR